MKSRKQHMIEGIELPNKEKIRTLGEKETYKYLEILEADTIKQVETKEKVKKEYLRRIRKLLETKLCSRNLIKGINTSYNTRNQSWNGPEKTLNKWARRKLMTMRKALHPRDDVDRLYVLM